MTKRVGNTIVFEPTVPSKCELCGKVAELRPYGPHGENICFACGMVDEETTKAKFFELLNGASTVETN